MATRCSFSPAIVLTGYRQISVIFIAISRFGPVHEPANVPVQRRAAQRTVRCNRVLCRAVRILNLVLLNEGRMQLPHPFDARAVGKRLDIKAQANLDILL